MKKAKTWIGGQNAERLRTLIAKLVTHVPGVRDWIEDQIAVEDGQCVALIARFENAIRRLRPPDRAVDLPMWALSGLLDDSSRAEHLIDAIQDLGFHDDLLKCIPYLIEVGIAQIETLYKDDCAGHEIQELLSRVLRSLPHSSMSAPGRILYADRLMRDDNYGLIPDVAPFLTGCGAGDWRDAAGTPDPSVSPKT